MGFNKFQNVKKGRLVKAYITFKATEKNSNTGPWRDPKLQKAERIVCCI